MARVAELHPWDSPEVTAFPVPMCLESYAAWVERTTSQDAAAPDA